MTLLRDLIPIPERVYKGDFVMRLTEGVERAEPTVDSYVVTPELVVNFDDALGFVESALKDRSSKATYLDGSFGSGKSHFMAILDLLLGRHPTGARRARAGRVGREARQVDGGRTSAVRESTSPSARLLRWT